MLSVARNFCHDPEKRVYDTQLALLLHYEGATVEDVEQALADVTQVGSMCVVSPAHTPTHLGLYIQAI
jgi:hypothetical protein